MLALAAVGILAGGYVALMGLDAYIDKRERLRAREIKGVCNAWWNSADSPELRIFNARFDDMRLRLAKFEDAQRETAMKLSKVWHWQEEQDDALDVLQTKAARRKK
ncbi:MAG TPA: hypothetical protein VEA41_21900 [Salinarimonas sp.]|nr:hypothetical protein [Salinarimonas sp.]